MNLIQQLKIQAMYARQAAQPKPVKAEPLDLTPEGIDAMDKAALVDLLEAHGVAVDKRKGVATLAAELKEVVLLGGDDEQQ